jgi:predicted MFS family arabinose efflux permease
MASKAALARPLDVPGQAAIGVGLATITYALIDGPTTGWHSPTVIGLLVSSIVAWYAFARIERTSSHALLEPRYLKSPTLWGSAILAIVTFLCVGAFLFFNTLYLQEVRHYSPLMSGVLIIPVTAAQLVLSPYAGKLTGARGPRLPATAATLFTGAAMAMLADVTRVATPIPVLLIAYLLLGVGLGLVNPPITNSAVSAMPVDRAGVAGAIAMTGRQIGTNLGVALIGAVIFSVATRASTSAGAADALGSHAGGIDFASGLRWGYGVATIFALVSTVVSLWAFRPITLSEPLLTQPH